MKKVINGKMYNTETAKLIGSYSYGNCGYLQYFEDCLYKKKTGEFFFYGHGGAASKYAEEYAPNNWCGGSCINPMTLEEAKEWAEKYLDADEYEAAFGKVEE